MSWGNFFCRSETNLTHKENDRLPAVQADVSLFAFTNREEMKKPLRFFQETFYYPKWHFHEPHTIFLRSQYFDNLKKNHPFSYESAIDDLLMQSAYNTLTKSEAFSIFGHTTIFSYQKLNKWLRLQVSQSITTPIKNLLNGALLKMPMVPGNTNYYRGITLVGDELMNFINQHKQGHSIIYKEFVSAANNKSDSFYDLPDRNIKITIETKANSSGRTIHDFSYGKFLLGTSDAALFMTDAKFEVLLVTNPGGNVYEFILKEID